MKVKFKTSILDVVSVNFEENTIRLETDNDIAWIHYSKCKLVDYNVYKLNDSITIK